MGYSDGFKNFSILSANYSNAMNRFTQLYHTTKKYLVAGFNTNNIYILFPAD